MKRTLAQLAFIVMALIALALALAPIFAMQWSIASNSPLF
jgi:hypothetical protein